MPVSDGLAREALTFDDVLLKPGLSDVMPGQADVRSRVTHQYYDAGHMMYTRDEDLAKLKKDLVAWLA